MQVSIFRVCGIRFAAGCVGVLALFGWATVARPIEPGTVLDAADPSPESHRPGRPERAVFAAVASTPNAIVARVQRGVLREAGRQRRPFRIEGFPLTAAEQVDLELTPFSVVSTQSQFVIGSLDGPDRPIAFDPETIQFFSGGVVGRPGSHVYLSISRSGTTGYVDLGPGAERYRVSETDGAGARLAPDLVSVFKARSTPGSGGNVPLCGTETAAPTEVQAHHDAPGAGRSASVAGIPASTVGRRHLELAVETDYEYFILFNDAGEAMDYLLQMYGEISAIYIRDVNVHIEVVFARLWDDPNDLFNGPEAIHQFWPYWFNNMSHVARDATQLLSGRRDYPYGGIAFTEQLCNFGYSAVGYVLGFQPDPTRPDPYNWDVAVCAHEIGHTFAARHTHDHGLDTCDDPNTTARRGSIMSYCGQTWSGMRANVDNFFHVVNQAEMRAHVEASSCLVADCNMNFVDDAVDIASATSSDANGNNVPDECEDCNGNGTLDPQDIALGTSLDQNGNGIPDECEPDCNNNGVPDDRDIALGTSDDVSADGIPDECDEDCNGNAVSDYVEILGDMTLDKNRNAILDACEDCDGDNVDDLTELGDAHGLWVASGLPGEPVRRFHPTVGVLMSETEGASPVDEGQDVLILPTGLVLVSSAVNDRIRAFSSDGSFVTDFVAAGAGGLDHPAGMALHPGGDLLVASRNTDRILRFSAADGSFVGEFIGAGSGGLVRPFGLSYGPYGNLFVTSDNNEILEYDGGTGAFIRTLVAASNNGGLTEPRGLTFKADGNLLVASFGTDEVLEFDGITGWPRGKWAQVGTETAITQDSPWGVRVGPSGHVYVTRTGTDPSSRPKPGDLAESHLTDARMFEYHGCTGDHRSTTIGGNDHGLDFASGFAFAPGWDLDCNFNQLQDNCDIASGASDNANLNGIPDECEVDCNGNGVYDRRDIWPNGSSLDCNCNGVPDECDLASAASADCNGNGRPDECELDLDCDGNGIQDICDVALGNDADCNLNGLLDSCELALPTSGVILSEDFESGLPAGWTATGDFQVTSACQQSPACDGSTWAYAGSTATCAYGDASAGAIVSPPILIPPNAPAELRFCAALESEAGFDFAEVVVNNTRVLRESGGSGDWEDRAIDLTPFAGEVATIMFRFESDSSVSGTLGWQVDDIEVTTEAGAADCNANDIPDACESDPVCFQPVQPDPDGIDRIRFISFVVPGGAAGADTALRVAFDSIASPPGVPAGRQVRYVNAFDFDGTNPGTGSLLCPDAAPTFPDYACARLGCEPEYRDWGADVGETVLYVTGNAVVPDSAYGVSMIAESCGAAPAADSCSSASTSHMASTAVWGDMAGPGNGPPDSTGNVLDIGAVVDKVKGLSTAFDEPRAWLKEQHPDPDSAPINVLDIGFTVDAVKGLPYPFSIDACP